MIPLLTADALSLGGSLPLSKPLPIKFVDWVTASQMADKLGVSEGSIGHYLPIALKGMFGENIEKRANKIADERRISLDQQLYTKHFDTETGLVLVWNDDKSCVAILHQNKSGGFNWRNYWEPKFAEKLMLKLANTIKDAKLPTVPVPTISA